MDQNVRSSKRSGEPHGGDYAAEAIIAAVADAVVIIGQDSEIVWADTRFAALPVSVQDRCRQWCGSMSQSDHRTHVEGAGRCFEITIRTTADGMRCCLLSETTTAEAAALRMSAIDASGMMLLHFDRDEISHLTVADRLQLLEQRIITSVKRELKFDNFEIRLRAPGSDRLELVISENLSPLRIGESISASETGNGISGWVAATGRSYVCGDVRKDPLYREGLDDARSSLTVPLRIQDKVIGVFNIESGTENVFDEQDRQLAERFGCYIANVLHLLDLLVVERISTSEQVALNMTSELERPIADLQELAATLLGGGSHDPADQLQRIVAEITNRVEACAAGPRSIIDAEHEMHTIERESAFEGVRMLVVDDEDRIRSEVTQVLEHLGCEVTACANGTEAFAALETAQSGDGFALVVSDIRLPNASGYEVFTKSREVLPDVPVILMTGFGYDPNHTIVRASADGVQGILLKPFRTSQLIDAVRNAIMAPASRES
jgi:CheY-like chemotaxis protein